MRARARAAAAGARRGRRTRGRLCSIRSRSGLLIDAISPAPCSCSSDESICCRCAAPSELNWLCSRVAGSVSATACSSSIALQCCSIDCSSNDSRAIVSCASRDRAHVALHRRRHLRSRRTVGEAATAWPFAGGRARVGPCSIARARCEASQRAPRTRSGGRRGPSRAPRDARAAPAAEAAPHSAPVGQGRGAPARPPRDFTLRAPRSRAAAPPCARSTWSPRAAPPRRPARRAARPRRSLRRSTGAARRAAAAAAG